MLGAVLAFQLWRSYSLESRLLAAETSRALLVGERLLQRGLRSAAVLAALPDERRLIVRGDRVVVDDSIAWLEPLAPEAERDIVVESRLDAAARAEFVDRDHAAAARQFDELLAGPLAETARLDVLAAACWQAHRSGQEPRRERLFDDLRARVAALRPAQLAGATVAAATASAERLAAQLGLQPVAPTLVPFLPAAAAAALAMADEQRARHRAIVDRRERLRRAQQLLTSAGQAAAATGEAWVQALPGDDGQWLWLTPLGADDDPGQRPAAVTDAAGWFAAVHAAGVTGQLGEWPATIEPVFAAPGAAAASFTGVPGLRELRSVTGMQGSPAWLVPAITALLLLGFAFAGVQQVRGARREAAAVAAQAQFLTTVTHELKTPLAGIRLLAEMLAEGRAPGREPEYYRLLVAESQRLSVLIENVLDLGRLERGERRYAPRVQPLAPIVAETLAVFAPVAESSGMRLEFDDGLGDMTVAVDRDAFVQALMAVLDNARKYGGGGGGIDVRTRAANGHVEVVVRDHGPGVPAAERERIFERFVRGAQHQHGSTPSVGIGLYLARSITRALGGELRCVAPTDGPGAEFCFTLRRADEQPDGQAEGDPA
ncbi:MAG: HAMP domain-containing sensor histidine kinase [Planctomycetota bacterium]